MTLIYDAHVAPLAGIESSRETLVEGDENRLLFERIRERCRQEAQHPEQFPSFVQGAIRLRDANGSLTSLPWPPATEAQLDATEARLHLPLPPMLRQLYHEIGNGGFGPGYGIVGAIGGAPHPGGWYKNIVDGYRSFKYFVDLADISEARLHGVRFELRDGTWPRYLVPFCYWGCNTEHAISAQTSEVFAVVDGCCFANWAPSLKVWLEQWLAGTLKQE